MNRLTTKIAAVALAVLLLGGVAAQAKGRKPKRNKKEDLSANPLLGVKSKQPDKELFDKAMIAIKKGRFEQYIKDEREFVKVMVNRAAEGMIVRHGEAASRIVAAIHETLKVGVNVAH